jgi:hypothetical protein
MLQSWITSTIRFAISAAATAGLSSSDPTARGRGVNRNDDSERAINGLDEVVDRCAHFEPSKGEVRLDQR